MCWRRPDLLARRAQQARQVQRDQPVQQVQPGQQDRPERQVPQGQTERPVQRGRKD